MELIEWEQFLMEHILSISMSIVLGIFAYVIARKVRSRMQARFEQSANNQAVKLFLTNLVYYVILFIAAVIILSKLGVPTATLVTLLGTTSLAIGLALKDSLSNIAAGIVIIFNKPFEIGDVVELSGTFGTVLHIDLFNTQLKTPAHESVFIPNGKIVNDKIINKAYKNIRRVEIPVGVSYDSDLKKVKSILEKLVAQENRKLESPEAFVHVNNFGDSSIDLFVKIWVHKDHFFAVKCEMLEKIKETFDKENIEIPFPQMDVHLDK